MALIAYRNIFDSCAFTSSNWNGTDNEWWGTVPDPAAEEVGYLQNIRLAEQTSFGSPYAVIDNTGTTSGGAFLHINLPGGQPVRLVAALNTSGSGTGDIGGTPVTYMSSITVTLKNGGTTVASKTINAPFGVDPNTGELLLPHYFVLFDQEYTADYVNVRFWVPINGSAAVGRLYVGPGWVLPSGIDADWNMEFIDLGKIQRSEGGQGWANPATRMRELGVGLAVNNFADAYGTDGTPENDNLQDFHLRVGKTGDFIIVPRTGSDYETYSTAIYGHITRGGNIRHISGGNFEDSFTVRELL